MASTIHHLSVAQLYYENYLTNYNEEEKNRFLLGSIAPDWSAEKGKVNGKPQKERRLSHFIDAEAKDDKLDLKLSTPNINKFKEKYGDKLNDPFTLGYYVHLLTDKFWFEVAMPFFIKKNLYFINREVRTIDDLSNKAFIDWYRQNFYGDYDVHNIIIGAMVFGEKAQLPNFLEFNLDNLLVEEIEIKCLKNFLNKNYERLSFLRTITDEEAMERFLQRKNDIKVADLPTTTEFINQCVNYCFKMINETEK